MPYGLDYEVLFMQFACVGLTLAEEDAQDRKIVMGMGREIEMTINWKLCLRQTTCIW